MDKLELESIFLIASRCKIPRQQKHHTLHRLHSGNFGTWTTYIAQPNPFRIFRKMLKLKFSGNRGIIFRLQLCCWQSYVDDFMMVTGLWCCWKTHYVGDILNRPRRFHSCYQYKPSSISVTNFDVAKFLYQRFKLDLLSHFDCKLFIWNSKKEQIKSFEGHCPRNLT